MKKRLAIVCLLMIFLSEIGWAASTACTSYRQGAIVFVLMQEPYGGRNRWLEAHVAFSPEEGLVNLGAFNVKSWAEIKQKLIENYNKCILIKQFKVSGRGVDGVMGLESDAGVGEILDISSADSLLGNLSFAFARNAHVEFSGCNIGRGCMGQDFLKKMSTLLISNGGGTITAPTTLEWGPFMDWALTDNISLRVSSGITNYRWSKSPETAQQCSDSLKGIEREIKSEWSMKNSCADRNLSERVKYVLANLPDVESKTLSRQISHFTEHEFAHAQSFLEWVRYARYTLYQLSQIKNCDKK